MWIVGLAALAAVVVVLAAVTIGVSVGGSSSSGPRSARGSTGSSGASSTTTTTTPSGPGPHISSLTPAQGPAGQSVTITGANLVSSDGQVVAHFGGQVAPTSCSSSTSCSATAPPGGSGRVQVTITTAGGRSNALEYTYQ